MIISSKQTLETVCRRSFRGHHDPFYKEKPPNCSEHSVKSAQVSRINSGCDEKQGSVGTQVGGRVTHTHAHTHAQSCESRSVAERGKIMIIHYSSSVRAG